MNIYLAILIMMHLLATILELLTKQNYKSKIVSIILIVLNMLLILGAAGVYNGS